MRRLRFRGGFSLTFGFGFVQIYQFNRNLFPFATFGAEVANTVAIAFVLARHVKAAVLQIKLESFAKQQERRY